MKKRSSRDVSPFCSILERDELILFCLGPVGCTFDDGEHDSFKDDDDEG